MKRFFSFVRKEFYHIFRDKRTMLILLVMPIVMIVLFGFAITTEVKNARLAILDYSQDAVTTRIREHFSQNRYFTLEAELFDDAAIDRLFRENKIDVVLVFNDHFEGELRHSGQASVQLLTDGSEPNQAAMRTGYDSQILATFAQRYEEEIGM